MARKKKSNVYFTRITDIAISAYNKSEHSLALREKIYRRFIYPAFMKLAENIINKVKPELHRFFISRSYKPIWLHI
jgi:hypothetical protein